MRPSHPKSLSPLGFLTVVQHAELGYFGGYLLVHATGRPLEFHCTAPVRPNRAQEILYGPTLRPFLCGEQIGQALLDHAKKRPCVLLTDDEHVLAGCEQFDLPTLLLIDSEAAQTPEEFRVSDYRLRAHPARATDAARFQQLWPQYQNQIELPEPFVRIREAIEEAQRGMKAA